MCLLLSVIFNSTLEITHCSDPAFRAMIPLSWFILICFNVALHTGDFMKITLDCNSAPDSWYTGTGSRCNLRLRLQGPLSNGGHYFSLRNYTASFSYLKANTYCIYGFIPT